MADHYLISFLDQITAAALKVKKKKRIVIDQGIVSSKTLKQRETGGQGLKLCSLLMYIRFEGPQVLSISSEPVYTEFALFFIRTLTSRR